MSQQIPRYRIDRFSAYGFTDDPKGKFCEYRDYAALAAENERLRKAGDAMADDLECMSENDLCFNSLEDWNAAKEGRDAK